MKPSRPSRFIATLVAAFSMLFMQLAVASYVCPGMAPANGGTAAATSAAVRHVAMIGCEGMDTDQPALCHAHAQGETAKQSPDKPELPDVQPFVPAVMVAAWYPAAMPFAASVTPPPSISLARALAPPIAIRHCCFRI